MEQRSCHRPACARARRARLSHARNSQIHATLMRLPLGFRFAGVHAGLKPVRRDVALVASDEPAVAAGCFTKNLAAAAPVVDARARVPASGIRAIVINSGNANALSGATGLADVRAIRDAFAAA